VAVARAAGVDRSFLYRHHDLRAQILQRAARAQSEASLPRATTVSRQSLLADLANLRAHNERLRRQNAKLARRLSEVLGEKIFRASGLGGGAADEAEALRRRVAELEQAVEDLRQQLTERTEELEAARATNRELMAEVNRLPGRWPAAEEPPRPRRTSRRRASCGRPGEASAASKLAPALLAAGSITRADSGSTSPSIELCDICAVAFDCACNLRYT
jgi:regulator of replication initiation timing